MKFVYIATIILFFTNYAADYHKTKQISAADTPGAVIGYTIDEENLLNHMLQENKPDIKNCGPAIQEGTIGFIKSLPNSAYFEPKISCLLSGYKNVLFEDDGLEYSDIIKQILHKNNVCYFYSPKLLGNNYIFYMPKGKLYASLLLKNNILADLESEGNNDMDIIRNDYITGHLLGYNDSDILAFYNHTAKRKNQGNPKTKFDQDKKLSLEWIKRNVVDINQWIEDNSSKYSIESVTL